MNSNLILNSEQIVYEINQNLATTPVHSFSLYNLGTVNNLPLQEKTMVSKYIELQEINAPKPVTSLSTEIATAHGMGKSFSFNNQPYLVRYTVSDFQSEVEGMISSISSISKQLVKNASIQQEQELLTGTNFNSGILNNPNLVEFAPESPTSVQELFQLVLNTARTLESSVLANVDNVLIMDAVTYELLATTQNGSNATYFDTLKQALVGFAFYRLAPYVTSDYLIIAGNRPSNVIWTTSPSVYKSGVLESQYHLYVDVARGSVGIESFKYGSLVYQPISALPVTFEAKNPVRKTDKK